MTDHQVALVAVFCFAAGSALVIDAAVRLIRDRRRRRR